MEKGLTISEIALQLGISEATVEERLIKAGIEIKDTYSCSDMEAIRSIATGKPKR